jgi:plasmid stabilization system protein ParE
VTSLVVAAEPDPDVDAIYKTLRKKAGLRNAAEYDRTFDAMFARLLEDPSSGPIRSALGKDIRIVVSPYVVVYRYAEDADHRSDLC